MSFDPAPQAESLPPWMASLIPQIDALRATGADFHTRGWSLGTSSNYSVVVSRDPFRLLITASGKDKGRLTRSDFVLVDQAGQLVEPGGPRAGYKPSAETLLHVVAAKHGNAVSILHTHSPWVTILSDHFHQQGRVTIEGYEMLKGLEGITTHDTSQSMVIFENTQDIPALARLVECRLTDAAAPLRYGFLLRRHGLYTWGNSIEAARRHVEVLEFLFEVLGRRLSLQR